MTTAQQMYHLNLDQIASLIKATGHKRTTLVQGHMGTGKSSLLNALGSETCPHIRHATSTAPPRTWVTSRCQKS
jgi:putative ribosome biogenesis GTPase RsgA